MAAQVINTGWVGFVRGDYRKGEDIEGWTANAGLRYNFVPEALAPVMMLSGKSLVKAQPAAPPDSGDQVVTAPVEIDGTVLFQLRGVSSFPAAVRARLVRGRIVAVAADRNVPVDALRIVDLGNAQTISVGDTVLLGLVEADASLEQVALQQVVSHALRRLRPDSRQAAQGLDQLFEAGRAVHAVILA